MIGQENSFMDDDHDRGPQNGRAYGEMIFDISCLRVHAGKQAPLLIDVGHDKRFIRGKIIVCKAQVVVDQKGLQISVVTDSIAAYPGIYQRECKEKQKDKQLLICRNDPGAQHRYSRKRSIHGDSVATKCLIGPQFAHASTRTWVPLKTPEGCSQQTPSCTCAAYPQLWQDRNIISGSCIRGYSRGAHKLFFSTL